MTSATDELRRLLDERGVRWWEEDGHTLWYGQSINHAASAFSSFMFGENDKVHLSAMVTPEQAIAATLGSEEPTYEQWRAISEAIGDAMEYAHDKAIEHPDKADPLWNLDEYVNRVIEVAFGEPVTLGSGECEFEYAHGITDTLKETVDVYFCSACGSPNYSDNEPMFCQYCGCGRRVKR